MMVTFKSGPFSSLALERNQVVILYVDEALCILL